MIRIGTSPMPPAQVLVELWPKIHALCPEIKFQLVPSENTPENAREILAHTVQKFLSATQTVLQVRLITQR